MGGGRSENKDNGVDLDLSTRVQKMLTCLCHSESKKVDFQKEFNSRTGPWSFFLFTVQLLPERPFLLLVSWLMTLVLCVLHGDMFKSTYTQDSFAENPSAPQTQLAQNRCH
jgi:hypothetical protein